MHNIRRHGHTRDEIEKDKIQNCYRFYNQSKNAGMDIILANTIKGINKFLSNNHTDLLVVHGDRVESLAGAITGCLNNIKVAHIEGEKFLELLTKLSDIQYLNYLIYIL